MEYFLMQLKIELSIRNDDNNVGFFPLLEDIILTLSLCIDYCHKQIYHLWHVYCLGNITNRKISAADEQTMLATIERANANDVDVLLVL